MIKQQTVPNSNVVSKLKSNKAFELLMTDH